MPQEERAEEDDDEYEYEYHDTEFEVGFALNSDTASSLFACFMGRSSPFSLYS